MKKTVLVLLLCIILSGCGNQKKIDEFITVADQYVVESKYETAIDTYEKALELKEDPSIRQKISEVEEKQFLQQIDAIKKYRQNGELESSVALINKLLDKKENPELRTLLSEIEKEKIAVSKVKSYQEKIKDVVSYYLQDSNYISPVKVNEANGILREAISNLESLDSSGDAAIYSYIREVKDNYDYGVVKRFTESTMTDDADVSESLGFMFDEMASLNEATGEYFILFVGESVKAINNLSYPSKYK
ncbi:hypothetical protein [Paenibacillus odorifer]|uniref:hypothetical protein n=1 Tax=Paenibacillus odorifer TaxID=189426 RepID=UPI00096DDE2B|nr:hypothetical protein [Paenibacillus odorifer]OMD71227.1 hypothetical protein BSK50_26475 [Paenibacillus odorifer]